MSEHPFGSDRPFETAELSQLVKLGRFHRVPKGETILAEGASMDGAYLVFRGKVLVRPGRRSAGHRVHQTLGIGDVFGQSTPGHAEPSPFRVLAAEDCALVHLDCGALSRLFAVDLGLGSRLLAKLQSRIAQVEEAAHQAAARGRLLAFYGPRGGAGTTSMAVLAAGHAGLLESRTLLLDLHPFFGEVAPLCEWRPQLNLVDLLDGDLEPEDLERAVTTGRTFDILAAPTGLADGERIDPARVRELLELALGEYDLVVADLPESITTLAVEVFDIADRVVMALTADFEGMLAGRKAFAYLEQLAIPTETVEVYLNRYRSNGGLSPRQLRETLGRPARVIAEDSGQLLRLANEGFLWDGVPRLPRHPLVRAVAGTVCELLGIQAPLGGPQPEIYQEERVLLPGVVQVVDPEAVQGASWGRWVLGVAALLLVQLLAWGCTWVP